ncbi:hypothetical protein GCM10023354_02660 [Garicola koreensis]|uniref:hypothetical protein n=1 Tax=Garicola koreensis TaxID=1262554 RepID=UPI0031EFA550
MHHVTSVPQHAGTRNSPAAKTLTGLCVVGLGALTACSGVASDAVSSDATGSAATAEATQTETSAPQTSESSEPQEEAKVEDLPSLDSEQMMDALISPSDLPEVPEGHSTHSGTDYFHQEIAVEFQDYRDRFGTSECTTTMDSINVDLVDEGAQDGLMYIYSFPHSDGDQRSGVLYAWMLSYDRPINTAPVWSDVGEHCSGSQLQNGADSVDVTTFDAGDFTGVQLGIHRESDDRAEDFTTFSASVDAGENLVMMSSVGLGEERFREVVQTQQQKLEQLSQDQLTQDQEDQAQD